MTATGSVRSSVAAGLGEDPVRVPYVGFDVGAPAGRRAGQQGAGVQQDDRVVVGVDDPCSGSRPLRHLMGVVHGGQAGADVEELPDARVGRQVMHDGGEEHPDAAGDVGHGGHDGEHFLGGDPVGREVVLAAEPVVVDARRVRHADVEGDATQRGLVLRDRLRLVQAPDVPSNHPKRAGLRPPGLAGGDRGNSAPFGPK